MLEDMSDFSPGTVHNNCPDTAFKHVNDPSVVLTNNSDL